MLHQKSSAGVSTLRRVTFRIFFSGHLPPCMALALAILVASASSPVAATTLYKCKLDGKTVFSDTDCQREVRIKKDAKMAKPRVIKIRQKSTSTRSR